MDENGQRIADLKEIIASLDFCEINKKDCKKCKKKDECLKFMRSSISLCLQHFLNQLGDPNDSVPTYFV